MAQKIATCCYCGARAALRLDRARHELACANCGAPLHEMKALKSGHEEVRRRALVAPSPVRGTAQAAPRAGHPRAGIVGGEALLGALGAAAVAATSGSRRTKGRRKSLSRKLMSEAWDVIEDIFD